jgi:hypothetical protein
MAGSFSIPGTQSLSGLTTVVADKCLVSPPEKFDGRATTKRPKDIFEQFLRVPEGIATYDGTWSAVDDRHCPGVESMIRYIRRRTRPAILDYSTTYFVRNQTHNTTNRHTETVGIGP